VSGHSCPQVIALLVDYLEGRLPDDTRLELARHLAGCRSCEAYVASYRSTVDLLHSISEDDLPPELRLRLRAFLDKRQRN
jgi:anti-sigma factor RsiW